MTFLPLNNALMIVGGRNDDACVKLSTPFLDDIHLFLLDQKAWVNVKYAPQSKFLYRLGNHCMATMTDSENFEKTIIFGGITHSKIEATKSPKEKKSENIKETSHLSNDLYVLEIHQIM
jgi:hypothetical protein